MFCLPKYLIFQNQDFISVMKRIEHLKINQNLRFNFEMNNLTKWTIYRSDIFDDGFVVKMKFMNVTKLNIEDIITDLGFDLMSKFKFPKLELLSFINCYIQNWIPSNSKIIYSADQTCQISWLWIKQV